MLNPENEVFWGRDAPDKNCEAVYTMLNPENAVFWGRDAPDKNCEAVYTMLNPENEVFWGRDAPWCVSCPPKQFIPRRG